MCSVVFQVANFSAFEVVHFLCVAEKVILLNAKHLQLKFKNFSPTALHLLLYRRPTQVCSQANLAYRFHLLKAELLQSIWSFYSMS